MQFLLVKSGVSSIEIHFKVCLLGTPVIIGLGFGLVLPGNKPHPQYVLTKCIFFNGNLAISIHISLKFVPKRSINNIPALVQALNRRQAFIWTSDCLVDWRIYAPPASMSYVGVCVIRYRYILQSKWLGFNFRDNDLNTCKQMKCCLLCMKYNNCPYVLINATQNQ